MANINDSFNSSSISSGNLNIINEEYDNYLNKKNSSLNNSSKFFTKNKDKKRFKKKYFMCKKCKTCPKINFDGNTLNMNCDCKEILNLRITDFNNNYSHRKQKTVKPFLCCQKHISYNYIYYCIDDKENLCEKCLEEFKKHENHSHDPLFSDGKNKEITNLYNLIIKLREIIPKGDYDYRERLNMIESFLECYKEFPCHNLYESIKSAKIYLENLEIKETKERLKIRLIKELEENKNESILFSHINISQQKFNNLSIFKKLKLINLKILILNENDINNIEPLYDCDFRELEEIHLESNKLNYKSLEDFQRMKFTKIKFINLFKNKIESPKIFEKIIDFKTLSIFHIGQNKFIKEEIIKNSNTKYDLSHLINIGLSGNFTNETIHFIFNIKFSNLEYLYLNRNNLSSLLFLKDIDCPNLVSFWAIINNITDYSPILKLKYKDKLKRINLKDNHIENIDNLIEFISNFKSLNLLILANNSIILNDQNKQILKDIKIKYNNLKLITEITKDNKIYLEEELLN